MLSYQAALAAGDYTAAIHGMRRFYDYQLAASARSMHQHSSLNIATFHYNTGGLQSALEAVEIAIRRARTANDSQCLHKCTQLEYRIKVEMESAAWPGFQVPQVKDQRLPPRRLREFQVSNDEIWAIKAAVDLGEPVHVVFRRVYTALSYHYMNVTGDGTPVERPEGLPAPHLSPAVWHGVQAGLWSLIGT
jgi:anaphase-promoting complex subunit 5